jgi:hypothetical protein
MTSGTTTAIWLSSFAATVVASYIRVSVAVTASGCYSQYAYIGTQACIAVAVTRSILIPLRNFSMVTPLVCSCTLYLFVCYFQNDICKNRKKTTWLRYKYKRAYAAGVLDLWLRKQVHSKLSLNLLPLLSVALIWCQIHFLLAVFEPALIILLSVTSGCDINIQR